MIIVKLNGGLGNQMFQYALYQAYLEQGVKAKLDKSKFTHFDEKRECFLDYGCFDLKYELCTKAEARQYVIGTGMIARVIARLLGDKKTHIYEKSEYEYDSDILTLRDGYIDGCWQSWKYIKDIMTKIHESFRFVNVLDKHQKDYEELICSTNSVAVHIRRGDYLKLQRIYGGICTEEYYRKAIEMMNDVLEEPMFYFFSNDIEWVKDTFGESANYVYVEGNGEHQGYIDMRLMSECKHQIIANSSFSWWAAFLNVNPNKMVICPAKWINTKDTPDVYCEDWIKI